ncbi:transmembrane signal receptor [Lithospermum erythrorhizon]|uniref:Transmembrane signal receptor n=1 Tax=Lithospermum erythrorhizon TaxID=34254 RepID=A0AAV3QCA3_LITER
MDLWEPNRTITRTGARFFITIVEDHIRSTWTYMINHKDQAIDILKNFVSMIQTQFETKVRDVKFLEVVFPYRDRSSTYMSTLFDHQTSKPCMPIDHYNTYETNPDVAPSSSPSDPPNPQVLSEDMSINESSIPTSTSTSSNAHLPLVRQSNRVKKFPVKSNDYIVSSYSSSSDSHIFTDSHMLFIANMSTIQEPHTYKQTCVNHEWIKAMQTKLMAKGYNQVEGIDYYDSFSPVTKTVIVRFILALVASMKWFLHQLDVNNVFLHGCLDEEVYMVPPEGYDQVKSGQVCRFKRSLYGLKQASRQWNNEFTSTLKAYGFVQSCSDNCMFVMSSNTCFMVLIVYADDIIIAGDLEEAIKAVKQHLHKKFTIKDLGLPKYFFGIEIFLSQRKYVLDIVKDMQLQDAHKVATPLQVDCKFMQHPIVNHWHTAIHVVKYLNGTPNHGLFYSSSAAIQLQGFCDADWARCKVTRKSITGYCVLLGTSLISWKSKKQNIVSKSSTEAEYRSLAFATYELKWLSYLFQDLDIPISEPIPLRCDNHTTFHIVENSVFHERTKHIEIDCHVVKDHFKVGFINPSHVSSKEQLADVFKKALSVTMLFHYWSRWTSCR